LRQEAQLHKVFGVAERMVHSPERIHAGSAFHEALKATPGRTDFSALDWSSVGRAASVDDPTQPDWRR